MSELMHQKMKLAIISDGNNTLGMGHIYQCMTLAGFIMEKELNSDIFFLTKSNEEVAGLLETTGCRVDRYKDDASIFEALKQLQPDRIIFDKLDVSPGLAKDIKNDLKARLIICTNLTEANEFADVTVLADIGSDFKNIYKKNPDTGQVNFFGPRYWILRPEFYRYKKDPSQLPKEIKKITLIFGGADPCNFSSGVLNEILKMNTAFEIRLILGGAFIHRSQLDAVIKNRSSSVSSLTILEKISNVAEIMSDSDLVFASPGLSFFEALAIGTPVIGFHQNDLQRDVYAGFLKTYGPDEVSQTASLIEDKQFNSPSDPFIRGMEIGQGKDDILNEILN